MGAPLVLEQREGGFKTVQHQEVRLGEGQKRKRAGGGKNGGNSKKNRGEVVPT